MRERQYELRIDRLEENLRDYERRIADQEAESQRTREETLRTQLQAGQQNYIPNGDFDFTRNTYYYVTDYVSTDGRVDADVSEESAFWFVHERDTSLETVTGAITATDATLTITASGKNSFDAAHVGAEIVVEGAGTAGADLVTTIASFTSVSEVELTDAAVTTVTGARVRWLLQELKEDSTDVDYEAGETPPSFGGGVPTDAVRTITADYTIGSIIGEHLTIKADATSGNLIVTLPGMEKSFGQIITIKKIDSSSNTVTVDGEGSETIDGAITAVITTQYESVSVQSDADTEYSIL